MDYDGLSSPESQQTGEVVPHSQRNPARFVILWHAMPPQKPIFRPGSAEPMALSTGCALSPEASAYGSEKQGTQAENRASHFDLMLEKNGLLTTFELFQLPIPGERFPVRRLPEHRIDYLDYEGPISGDRGYVTQWTAGHYLTAVESDNKWILELYSPRLSARIVLLRPTSDNITASMTWHLRAARWDIKK
jgi:hypothetical protein